MTASILEHVLEVNARYYEAFAARDLEATMGHWSERDDIVCIPPMGEPGYGREGVEAVYRATFAVTIGTTFETHVLDARYDDPLATVTCAERITKPPPGPVNDLLATNVYLLERDGWRLVHHHVSWRSTAGVHPMDVAQSLDGWRRQPSAEPGDG